MPESLVRSAKVPSVLSSKPSLCPRVSCVGKLELDSRMGSMTAKGLQALVCPVCKHSGYRSLQGIRVLFATRHEHVCNYGPSVQSLTVVFSGAALVSLRDRGLCPTQSALMAAQWALLCGQLVGTLRVFPDSPALVHCFTHQRGHAHAFGQVGVVANVFACVVELKLQACQIAIECFGHGLKQT